jgi:2-dehydropantoate 2-reductase
MRFVVIGVGAVGGMLAGKLSIAGEEVIGVARGAHLEAINRDGLLIETAGGDEIAHFPCVASPDLVDFQPDDIVIVTVKVQDMQKVLLDLREAGVDRQPLVCAQNGVDGERMALRIFPNVYGMCVRLPTNFDRPGVLQSWGYPIPGNLDIGRYPKGKDATCDAIVAALAQAGYIAEAHPDIMKPKYEKLIANLANVLEAAFGRTPPLQHYLPILRAEGQAVFAAAGIDIHDPLMEGRTPKAMTETPVKGRPRPGASSWQSLQRGTGSSETDYLNGEILLLGRLHGVPTPANAYFARLGQHMARIGAQPGSADPARVAADLVGLGVG